jgi:hypothetical protein
MCGKVSPPSGKNHHHVDGQFPLPGSNVRKGSPASLVMFLTAWHHSGTEASGNVEISPPGPTVQKRRIQPQGQISQSYPPGMILTCSICSCVNHLVSLCFCFSQSPGIEKVTLS